MSNHEVNNRVIIEDYITSHPGEYLESISFHLYIPKSTCNYHINKLMKMEKIKKINDNKIKRIYPINYNILNIPSYELEILDTLRKEDCTRKTFYSFNCYSRSTNLRKIDKLIEEKLIICYRKKGKCYLTLNYNNEKIKKIIRMELL